MKKYFLLFLLLSGLEKIYAQQSSSSGSNSAIMTFKSDTFNFGTATQGPEIEHDFVFTNTGTTPLFVSSSNTACGCDVASYPKEPIAPGKSGVIHYRLDTVGRVGPTDKTITVIYNTDQIIVLHVRGRIIILPPEK